MSGEPQFFWQRPGSRAALYATRLSPLLRQQAEQRLADGQTICVHRSFAGDGACYTEARDYQEIIVGEGEKEVGRARPWGEERRGDLSERQQWRQIFFRLQEQLQATELKKVALGRRQYFRLAAGQALSLLERFFSHDSPATYRLLCRRPGDKALFLCASPETLVRFQDRQVWVDCLAGTARPGEEEVLQTPKIQQEHQYVEEDIAQQLARHCSEFALLEKRQVKKLPGLLHLHGLFQGRLHPRSAPFDLIEDLHGSAAVVGLPRQQARDFIAQWERPRQLYTGSLGAIGPRGGDVCVGIRSAWLGHDFIEFCAGAGLTAQSHWEEEFEETEAKIFSTKQSLFGLGAECER